MSQNKILLGYRNYRFFKSKFYESDFKKILVLQKFLNQVLTGESDITSEGIAYLQKIGIDTISKELAHYGGLTEDKLFTPEEIKERILELEPFSTQKFIDDVKNKGL